MELYLLKKTMTLVIGENNKMVNNLPYSSLSNSDFEVQKGYPKTLFFKIKNRDRKGVTLYPTYTTKLTIIDHEHKLLFKEITGEINLVLNQLSFLIDAETTDLLRKGLYQYNVVLYDNNIPQLLYFDQNEKTFGFFLVRDNLLHKPPHHVKITQDDFSVLYPTLIDKWLYSQTYPCNDGYLHTILLNMTNFSGQVKIEGTLETTSDPYSLFWSEIPTTDQTIFNLCSGNTSISFYGKYNWIRIKYLPTLLNVGMINNIIIKV
jgi:hypothetical protein